MDGKDGATQKMAVVLSHHLSQNSLSIDETSDKQVRKKNLSRESISA